MRYQRPRNLADLICVAHDFIQVGPYHAPELCQGDRRLSLKQRSAKLPLERDDGVGQRRLRDAAAGGCAAEVELLAQRYEVLDLLHFHGLPSAPHFFGLYARTVSGHAAATLVTFCQVFAF
jgi:hypothetical protein